MKKLLVGLLALGSISSFSEDNIKPINFIVKCDVQNANEDNISNPKYHAVTIGRTSSLDSRGVTNGNTVTLQNGEKRSYFIEDLSHHKASFTKSPSISLESGSSAMRIRICEGVDYCGVTTPSRVLSNEISPSLAEKEIELKNKRDANFLIQDPSSEFSIQCRGIEINQYHEIFNL